MTRSDIIAQIQQKKSCLCVGLDTDISKLPSHLGNSADSILEFNKAIIEATSEYAVSYKLNTAFYEVYGAKGWEIMQETIQMIPPNCFTIADAKRGDIGNTSNQYSKAAFDSLGADSITVAPYMGKDSVYPFFQENKWVIVLGHTSNPGSQDFQKLRLENGKYLYEEVIDQVSTWGNPNNTMFVIGATHGELMKSIRARIPKHFLLVPGVGAQGGSLEDVMKYGSIPEECGLLINSSRQIIYASQGEDFAEKAREVAKTTQIQMRSFL